MKYLLYTKYTYTYWQWKQKRWYRIKEKDKLLSSHHLNLLPAQPLSLCISVHLRRYTATRQTDNTGDTRMNLAWNGSIFIFLTVILITRKAEGGSSLFSHQEKDSFQRKSTSHQEQSSTHAWYPIYKETFLFFVAVSCAICGLYVCLSMTFCHEHFYFMPLPETKDGQLRYVWLDSDSMAYSRHSWLPLTRFFDNRQFVVAIYTILYSWLI